MKNFNKLKDIKYISLVYREEGCEDDIIISKIVKFKPDELYLDDIIAAFTYDRWTLRLDSNEYSFEILNFSNDLQECKDLVFQKYPEHFV